DAKAASLDGTTALHVTMTADGPTGKGDMPYKIVNLLIEKGADVNAVDSYGWTPLMTAVAEGTADGVKALLAAKANPNQIIPHSDKRRYINNGRTILMVAVVAFEGDEKVRALLSAGADPTVRDAFGLTPTEFTQQQLNPPGKYKEKHQLCLKLIENAIRKS